jgi:Flp pilus assembly CpaE family ATPase
MTDPVRKILLVEDNAGDARVVHELIAEAGRNSFQLRTVETLVAALGALAEEKFDAVLLDLLLPDSQGIETLLTLRRHNTGVPILLLTGLDSESMALAAVKQGAQDFLVKNNLRSEQLVRALRYSIARHQSAPEPAGGAPIKAKIVAIFGAKGGVGATTFTCNYALELRRLTGEPVLVLDLDTAGSSAAFLMKPEPEYTILDAGTNLHRLDARFWKGVVSEGPEGVNLLRSPGSIRLSDSLDADRVRHVLRFVRSLYQYILVDFGRITPFSRSLVDETSEQIVVSTPELPSLLETGRSLKMLLESGAPKATLHVVINRMSKALACPQSYLEEALSHPIAATFGDYTAELHELYGNGRFLDSASPLRKEAGRLAARFTGVEPAPRKSRRFLGLVKT